MNVIQDPIQYRVFIVDDSALVVDRLKQLLNDYKHIVVVGSATNITSALSSIEEMQPNVIVIDIHLKENTPGRNGTDLLCILRKMYSNKLLIMLSNLVSSQYIKRCMELGADHFLDKSNDFDKIPEILNEISRIDKEIIPLKAII